MAFSRLRCCKIEASRAITPQKNGSKKSQNAEVRLTLAVRYANKDAKFYENGMAIAFEDARRCCTAAKVSLSMRRNSPYFAHQSLASPNDVAEPIRFPRGSQIFHMTGAWNVEGSDRRLYLRQILSSIRTALISIRSFSFEQNSRFGCQA